MDILKFESFGGSFAFFLISLFASFKIKKKLEMFLENSFWFSATWIIFVTFGKIQFHCLYFCGTTHFMCRYIPSATKIQRIIEQWLHTPIKQNNDTICLFCPSLLACRTLRACFNRIEPQENRPYNFLQLLPLHLHFNFPRLVFSFYHFI